MMMTGLVFMSFFDNQIIQAIKSKKLVTPELDGGKHVLVQASM